MRFFVDLDHTLLQTPQYKTLGLHESQLPHIIQCSHTFDGAFISILRKDAHFFLEELCKRGEVFLLTASHPSYFQPLLDIFDLRKYFKECYSTHRDLGEVITLNTNQIFPVDDYIMIDDLDRGEEFCIFRKKQLIEGIVGEEFAPQHYLQVCPFHYKSHYNMEWLRHRGLKILDELITLRKYPQSITSRVNDYKKLEEDFDNGVKGTYTSDSFKLWEGQVPWEIIFLNLPTYTEYLSSK